MRRWTRTRRAIIGPISQTSAYAEMDRSSIFPVSLILTNLRICGDGPLLIDYVIRWRSKPPHMRRWTARLLLDHPHPAQTSAYAEMDPFSPFPRRRKPSNLRICGDGPFALLRNHGVCPKPPHTRRWTRTAQGCQVPQVQTSAYAEMDLKSFLPARRRSTNLRIRRDGPSSPNILVPRRGKPPHMRRWTRICDEAAKDMDQTSAYAEMDPKRTTT